MIAKNNRTLVKRTTIPASLRRQEILGAKHEMRSDTIPAADSETLSSRSEKAALDVCVEITAEEIANLYKHYANKYPGLRRRSDGLLICGAGTKSK